MTETPATPKATAATTTGLAREVAITKAYTAATKQLREKHLAEFNALRVKATKKLGFDWTPPPTEKDKARAALEEILKAHPDLAHEVVTQVGKTIDGSGPEANLTTTETPSE